MRNKWLVMAAAVAAFAAYSTTVIAVPIDGIINFDGSAVYTPNNGSMAGVTGVTTWLTKRDPSGSVDYQWATGAQVVTMGLPPWNFNSPVPNGKFNFWAVNDGFGNMWYFNMTSSAVASQNGTFLSVVAVGTLTTTLAGKDPTPGLFNFTSTGPPSLDEQTGNWTYTWAAASGPTARFQVPDGGTTVALLGFALFGIGLLRRKLSA